MFKRVCLVLAAMSGGLPAAAACRFEAPTSRLDIIARFEGTEVPGRFADFEVELGETATPPAGARLAVTVRTGSASFASPEVTAAVREADWFDVARFPAARFEAPAIAALGGGRYVAHGTLDLKGVRHALDVPLAWRETPQGAALSGEFTLTRGSFGIGTGRFEATDEVGAEVIVRFTVALRRDG